MSNFIRMTDLDLAGKRVLIRADLNVPVKDGKVTSDARITASMATINHCLKAGAKVMVTSHLGRPEEGVWSEAIARGAVRVPDRLGAPDTGPDVRVCRERSRTRSQGHHRRRGRSRPPARHDGGEDTIAGDRRAGSIESAEWNGLAALHRANARRYPGRYAGHR